MIRIIDTYSQINTLFDYSTFNYEKWVVYMNSIYENSSTIFKNEIDEYINSGKYTFDNDFLPVINAVYNNPKLEILHENFISITININERILKQFSREVHIDIVLYLGLCNAAGWVTRINGFDTILLGVEKIIELNWYNLSSMYGLIYHELGHVYQEQYGILSQASDDNKKNFVWQLFTEGIAMYFEQTLVGNYNYYHQDAGGWKEWCDNHFVQILRDFNLDLPTMTQFEQRYFGDWCNYHGYSDVGYYLGARFVHHLLGKYYFDEMISFNIDFIYELYVSFMEQYK